MTTTINNMKDLPELADPRWWADQRALVADEWIGAVDMPRWWHHLKFWKPRRSDPLQVGQGFALIAIRAELRHLADVIERRHEETHP